MTNIEIIEKIKWRGAKCYQICKNNKKIQRIKIIIKNVNNQVFLLSFKLTDSNISVIFLTIFR